MQATVAEALQRVPGLAGLGDRDAQTLFGAAAVLRLDAGDTVFHAGAECRHFLIITQGSVRVTLNALSGRSVTLYRLEPGDTCVLTTSCLMSSRRYPAEAHTETAVTALAMGRSTFDRGLEESAPFRRFVLDSFSRRLAGVIERMEAVALTPVEARLAALLLALDPGDGQVSITHQRLAEELGTAREVISRHLKRLEGAALLTLGRGVVTLSDQARLRAIADEQPRG